MKLLDSTGVMPFTNIAKDKVLAPSSGPIVEGIMVGRVEVGNSSGDDAAMGWGYQPADAEWKSGQWDVSATGSEYIDDTTDAQDAGTDDFALTTTTDDDGFVVQSLHKFNVIGITVSTAAAGGTPAYSYKYWNGSAWATLNLLTSPDLSGTGDTYIVFLAPHDWTSLASGDSPVTSGLDAGKYAILVQATTAPTGTAALATVLWPVKICDYIEVVSDGQSVVKKYDHGMVKIPATASVVPYCSTADNANWVSIDYTKSP